ncbi:protein of unknown function [Spirosomataceae bacterium TFI 002]|nr:protein of unknown function [Spirosomataceae bacterium TFI 002]
MLQTLIKIFLIFFHNSLFFNKLKSMKNLDYFWSMIEFTLVLEKLELTGEKEGWTCAVINSALADQINPKVKTSYRIKGTLDKMPIKQKALIPIGEGNYILPFNSEMRKSLAKEEGATVQFKVEVDNDEFEFSADFLACLEDDERAMTHYQSLAPSHQKYFSKWVESAKTIETKTKRITQALFGLANKMDYGSMIRHFKKK